MPSNLRVLLLEESAADAERVHIALKHADTDVETHHVLSADAFVAGLREFSPDVALCCPPPQFDVVAALEMVRTHRPAAPLILLSNGVEEPTVVQYVRAGVENVISKNRLAALKPSMDRALAARRGLTRLSPRQVEVVRLIAAGLSSPEIARTLGLSVKTVDTHRTALMRRLDIHDVSGLVRFAVRVGLVPVQH